MTTDIQAYELWFKQILYEIDSIRFSLFTPTEALYVMMRYYRSTATSLEIKNFCQKNMR